MIMQNKLKPETIPAIDELNEAKIRTLMVTGKNRVAGRRALAWWHDRRAFIFPADRGPSLEDSGTVKSNEYYLFGDFILQEQWGNIFFTTR